MFEQNNVGVRLESPCALRVKLLGPGSQDEDNVIRYLRAAETIVEGLQGKDLLKQQINILYE